MKLKSTVSAAAICLATISLRAANAWSDAAGNESIAPTATTDPATQPSPRASLPPSRLPALAEDQVVKLNGTVDTLISTAVRRSYGWGWQEGISYQPANARTTDVTMAALGSPAAGMALLLAGDLLDNQPDRDAAREAARGVSVSLQPTGAIHASPIFGPASGGHEKRAFIQPRDSTIAGLAMLLAELNASDGTSPSDERLRSAAMRATSWLIKQQAKNSGGFPTAFPPNAEPRDSIRIIRLDSSDYRDTVAILFLAGEILHYDYATDTAMRAATLLTKLRLAGSIRSSNLWGVAYTIEGIVADDSLTFPGGADSLSSRYALETMIIASIFSDDRDKTFNESIERGARSLTDNTLVHEDEPGAAAAAKRKPAWERFPEPGVIRKPAATRPAHAGIPTTPAIALPIPAADFGIASTLEVAMEWQTTDRATWRKRLNERLAFGMRKRLLAMCTGLIDQPLVNDGGLSTGSQPAPTEELMLKDRLNLFAHLMFIEKRNEDAK